jgi:hypothetical protein
VKIKFFIALTILGSALNVSAAVPVNVKQCIASVAQGIAQRHASDRGGDCAIVKIKTKLVQPGYISLQLGAKRLPSINAYGELTLSCTGALFFPNTVMTRDWDAHAITQEPGGCTGGQDGWQL